MGDFGRLRLFFQFSRKQRKITNFRWIHIVGAVVMPHLNYLIDDVFLPSEAERKVLYGSVE